MIEQTYDIKFAQGIRNKIETYKRARLSQPYVPIPIQRQNPGETLARYFDENTAYLFGLLEENDNPPPMRLTPRIAFQIAEKLATLNLADAAILHKSVPDIYHEVSRKAFMLLHQGYSLKKIVNRISPQGHILLYPKHDR